MEGWKREGNWNDLLKWVMKIDGWLNLVVFFFTEVHYLHINITIPISHQQSKKGIKVCVQKVSKITDEMVLRSKSPNSVSDFDNLIFICFFKFGLIKNIETL